MKVLSEKENDFLLPICSCGYRFSSPEIDISNGTNEEGEEYTVITADCPICKEDYEVNDWGHCETQIDAISILKHYLNPSCSWIIKQPPKPLEWHKFVLANGEECQTATRVTGSGIETYLWTNSKPATNEE